MQFKIPTFKSGLHHDVYGPPGWPRGLHGKPQKYIIGKYQSAPF